VLDKLIVMGPQGCGKGTQAKRLKERYDLVHIAVGDILRWNVQSHTKLGTRVRRIMASGLMVPDDIIEEVVHRRLDEHDWNYGFILDGFPRNRTQTEFLLENYNLDGVIYIDVPDDVVIERMLARRVCARCGLDYNLIAHRPVVAETCDVCSGRLLTREDDQPEAIRRRLTEYHHQTQPVVDSFRRRKPILVVDGTRSPDEIAAQIRDWLEPPAERAERAAEGRHTVAV
jgi:adenylate kinase